MHNPYFSSCPPCCFEFELQCSEDNAAKFAEHNLLNNTMPSPRIEYGPSCCIASTRRLALVTVASKWAQDSTIQSGKNPSSVEERLYQKFYIFLSELPHFTLHFHSLSTILGKNSAQNTGVGGCFLSTFNA